MNKIVSHFTGSNVSADCDTDSCQGEIEKCPYPPPNLGKYLFFALENECFDNVQYGICSHVKVHPYLCIICKMKFPLNLYPKMLKKENHI